MGGAVGQVGRCRLMDGAGLLGSTALDQVPERRQGRGCFWPSSEPMNPIIAGAAMAFPGVFGDLYLRLPVPEAVSGQGGDPERPEPELSRPERRAERRRLRAVRNERRRQKVTGGKNRKKAKKGK